MRRSLTWTWSIPEVATGANIFLVYVGNSANYSAFDAITYAVDSRIASIVSSSYGDCETDLGSGNVFTAIIGVIASCGGSSSSSTTTTTEYATKGTYTLTVVGTDTTSSSTTASATMTLTID